MSGPKGFLLAMMEPPPALEEEFNDWYDTEHIPERMRIPGFESAHRYVCVSGWPRYMAIYDLATPDVLRHERYLAVSGPMRGPWTARLHKKHLGLYHASGIQVFPGAASTGNSSRMVLVRMRGTGESLEPRIIEALNYNLANYLEISQTRLFRSLGQEQVDHIALIEATELIDNTDLNPSAFGVVGGHIDAINTYALYSRRAP
jgi:hypothetical protein